MGMKFGLLESIVMLETHTLKENIKITLKLHMLGGGQQKCGLIVTKEKVDRYLYGINSGYATWFPGYS